MWPADKLQRLLGLDHPIIQAPMLGASTPAMAAAVSNAGGLGSIGCAMMAPQQLRETAAAIAASTNRAVNFNFFAPMQVNLDGYDAAPMREALTPHFAQYGLGEPPAPAAPPQLGFNDEVLEALLEIAPKVVSFHFGLPGAHAIAALKQKGVKLIGCATSTAEAKALESAGMDAIVAQGAEAGGHRGTFLSAPHENDMGLMALVPLIADAVKAPVIAAGGLFDGRGVAAAFMLGASGAQLGTAFLRSDESAVPPPHKDALARTPDNATRLTRLFTGRPARTLRGRVTEELGHLEAAAAPFPAQRMMMAPLGDASLKQGQGEFHPFWSGQGGARTRTGSAGDILRQIAEEAQRALGG